MKFEAEIKTESIESIVTDALVKKLLNEAYNKYFNNFATTRATDLQAKVNTQLKSEINSIVSNRVTNWKNSHGETLFDYIDRRIEESISNIDFEKIIKDRFIK